MHPDLDTPAVAVVPVPEGQQTGLAGLSSPTLAGSDLTGPARLLWPGRSQPRPPESQMTASQSTPTTRQLGFLRSLAEQTATTFVHPKTRAQASAEIGRLLRLRKSAAPDRDGHANDRAEAVTYATALHDDEIVGFGASATWRSRAPEQVSPPVPNRQWIELARYSASSEARLLCLESVQDERRVTDRPASGDGPRYLVEPDCQHEAPSALEALTSDYLTQATKLDVVPMASRAVRQVLRMEDSDAERL